MVALHSVPLLGVLLILVSLSAFSSAIKLPPASVLIQVPEPLFIATNNSKLDSSSILRLGLIGMGNDIIGPGVDGILAVAEWLNNNPNILPNTSIEIHASPYSAVDTDNLFDTVYHIKSVQIQGLIGGLTSQSSKVMQEIAKLFAVPQISPNAISNSLSDKTLYPTFFRTISSDFSQIAAIVTFFNDCKWKKGVIFYSQDEYGAGYSTLVSQAAANNITLTAFPTAVSVPSYQSYLSLMKTVKSQSETIGRIFIIYMTDPIMSQYAIQAMNESGLVGPDYVTILTTSAPDSVRDPSSLLYNSPLLDGAFGVGAGRPHGEMYDTILSYWKNITTLDLEQDQGLYVSPFYCIDAVLAYAYAFDTLLNQGWDFYDIYDNKTILLSQLLNQTFLGTTGQVVLDANGNRLGRFDMINFRYNQPAAYVGTYDVQQENYTKLGDYVFYGGSTKIPRDGPFTCSVCSFGTCVVDVGCVCNSGYTGTACDVKKSSPIVIVPWLIPLIVVILGTFIGVYFWYKKKRSALVKEVANKQRSLIARSDLVMQDRIGRGASGEVCKALFRGTDVAVKKIITSHVSKDVIEEFELEVAIMCGLRHPNIILFMGSCYDPTSQEMLLVMELMSRGSLHDVLNNSQIPMSYEMKLSLACQAAQGMNFLHMSTPPLVHRDLKSHNILIDDKWNARISDFGITKFKEDTRSAKSSSANKERSIGTIYWTAPEVLQGELSTEKCDCYSFGIVLWEIFHRLPPYATRDPVSVAVDVIRNNLRPPIAEDIPADMKELMQACWAPVPENRPSFQSIMTTLRKLLSTRSFATPSSEPAARVDAPTGHVYLVATGVEEAYTLWEAIPRGMEEAMKLHNQVLRSNLELYTGYEVSFADHSFVAAFGNLEDAVNFCTATQNSLLHAHWPVDLLSHPSGRAVYDGGELVWTGLKVKMGIASGVPNCEIDSATGRMKYFGTVVEKASQLLGLPVGYILASDSVATEIIKNNPRFVHDITTKKLGDIKSISTSARNKTEDIYQININALRGRSLSSREMPSALPHVVVAVQEFESEEVTPYHPPSPKDTTPGGPLTVGTLSDVHSVNWVTTKAEIGIKDAIGKGPIGDYFRGNWRGKEVAVKVLVNQKLKESDLLRLLGDSAYMSKLDHPNILPFYSVCLEPNYISVVSEYVPRGSLKALLADPAVQIPWTRKVKIALELAQGLAYLTSLPDPTLQVHDNLKSNNVLIGKDWEVKVADYGHGNIRELARTMTSVGNIAWTAPEILNGLPSTPSIALYSYGIILWELFTRQIPYENEHPIRVVTKILSGYRPAIPADCPAPYRQIMEECLRGEPENRPAWGKIISTLASM